MDTDLEARRSAVRRWVTYMAMVAFCLFAGFLIYRLAVVAENIEAALGVFGTVAALTSGVIGYWFASRAVEKKP